MLDVMTSSAQRTKILKRFIEQVLVREVVTIESPLVPAMRAPSPVNLSPGFAESFPLRGAEIREILIREDTFTSSVQWSLHEERTCSPALHSRAGGCNPR